MRGPRILVRRLIAVFTKTLVGLNGFVNLVGTNDFSPRKNHTSPLEYLEPMVQAQILSDTNQVVREIIQLDRSINPLEAVCLLRLMKPQML